MPDFVPPANHSLISFVVEYRTSRTLYAWIPDTQVKDALCGDDSVANALYDQYQAPDDRHDESLGQYEVVEVWDTYLCKADFEIEGCGPDAINAEEVNGLGANIVVEI